MTRNKYGKRWAQWNEKLSRYDLVIDLADIRTLSRRMYETGKVSRKVIKKWHARGRRVVYGNKKLRKFKWCDHRWMPYHSKQLGSSSLHWRCDRCRCSTSWLWLHEVLPSFLCEPFLQHTRVHPDYEVPHDSDHV